MLTQALISDFAVNSETTDQSTTDLAHDSTRAKASTQKKWTVMVYMAADNNLETYGIEDMNEMEEVGSSSDVNLLVQFDRHPTGSDISGYSSTNGDWTDTRRFLVQRDNDIELFYNYTADENMWLIGETNMAARQTFRSFMEWSLGNFSAEHYLLVMWNHGDGIFSSGRSARNGRSTAPSESEDDFQTRGVCNDETNSGWLNLWDMSVVLDEMKNSYETTIDIIGFDVCWLGTIETAYQLMPYANYLDVSQEEEPNPGWNYYSPMSTLVNNPDMTPKELAIKIAKDFKEEYKDEVYREDKYMTYAAVDLSRFEKNLVPLINDFANLLAKDIADNYYIINNARKNTDVPRKSGRGYMRDFFHFVELINSDTSASAELRVASKALLDEYNQTILRFEKGSLRPNHHGLYIYFPDQNYQNFNNEYEKKLTYSNEAWDEFIELFLTPIQIEHVPLNDTEEDSNEIKVSAIVKGSKLDDEDIWVFYYDSVAGGTTPVQMIREGSSDIFSTNITVWNYDTQVSYYIKATDTSSDYITAPQKVDFGDTNTWYSFYVGADKIPPVIVHNPITDVDVVTYGEPYKFYVNITDNLGLDTNSLNFYYNTNNSGWYNAIALNLESYPNRFYCLLLPQPPNTIIYYYFSATDLASSPNTIVEPIIGTFEFNVSRTKPKAGFQLSTYQGQTYEEISFTSTSQPEKFIVSYLWDFGDGSLPGTEKNISHYYTTPNVYTITLTVVDENGLSDSVEEMVVIINSPPQAIINTTTILVNGEIRELDSSNFISGVIYEDDEITLNCTDSEDKDGYIKKWTWDFGDNNEYNEICQDRNQDGIIDQHDDPVIPLTKMTPGELLAKLNSTFDGRLSYKYTHEGTYTIKFMVTDNEEAISDTQIIHVNIKNCPPMPEPGYRIRGLTVEFFADVDNETNIDSPSDYGTLNFTWDFGDGKVDYSPNPNHTFSNHKKYEVTLTVTDDDGVTVNKTFHVDLVEKSDNTGLVLGSVVLISLIIIIVIILMVIRRRNRMKSEPAEAIVRVEERVEMIPGAAPVQRRKHFEGNIVKSKEWGVTREKLMRAKVTGGASRGPNRTNVRDTKFAKGEKPAGPSEAKANVRVSDILSKIQQK